MKTYFSTLSLFLIMALTGCGGSDSETDSKLIKVEGSGDVPGFTIQNLYGWEVDVQPLESANQEDILYLDCLDDVADHPVYSLVSLAVSTKPLEVGIFPEEFAEMLHESETLLTNDPKPLDTFSAGDLKGWTFQYKFAVGVRSVVDVFVFNAGNTMYIINCTTTEDLYEEHSRPKFEAMAKTFTIETTE